MVGKMFEQFSAILSGHPELALFLALGIGYAIGKITFGSFTVGAVTGCLIAGVLVGQTGVVMSNDVKQAFFLLFLFAIGYRTGPQFFQSLNAKALPQVAVTLILCFTALGVVLAAALALNLGTGTAAGLLAGATTESATVGVAIDAFRKTGADAAAIQAFEADVATAFAVAYLVGVIATIIMLSQIAPRFLGRTLAEACAELEASMNAPVGGETSAQSARRSVEARAYVIGEAWVGMTLAQAEAKVPPDVKAYVEQVRRGDEILPATHDLRLKAGDVVAVVGLREFLVGSSAAIGTEVDDAVLLDVPADSVDVVVTNRDIIDQSLFALNRRPEARTVFLRRVTRAGQEIPIYGGLTVERGDVLTLVGSKRHVEEAAAVIGYADRPTTATDMVFVGIFIFLGGLIGIPALRLGAVELGLGVAVGTLLGGLVAGLAARSIPQVRLRSGGHAVALRLAWTFRLHRLRGHLGWPQFRGRACQHRPDACRDFNRGCGVVAWNRALCGTPCFQHERRCAVRNLLRRGHVRPSTCRCARGGAKPDSHAWLRSWLRHRKCPAGALGCGSRHGARVASLCFHGCRPSHRFRVSSSSRLRP